MAIKIANILSRVLSVVYIVAGGTKVFPVSHEAKIANLQDFAQFTKVSPMTRLGLQLGAASYMQAVGLVEIALGAGLLLGSRRVRQVCCIGLIIIMVGAAHTLYLLDRLREMPIPCAFLGLLVFNFYKLAEEGIPTGRPKTTKQE